MARAQRRRHYVSGAVLALVTPLFRYSQTRDAYVLRVVGNSHGPVLRRERRSARRDYQGTERRQQLSAS
jgi:hypothetical protein